MLLLQGTNQRGLRPQVSASTVEAIPTCKPNWTNQIRYSAAIHPQRCLPEATPIPAVNPGPLDRLVSMRTQPGRCLRAFFERPRLEKVPICHHCRPEQLRHTPPRFAPDSAVGLPLEYLPIPKGSI